MFDINYKTIFLIDHGAGFSEASGIQLEIDTGRPPPSSTGQNYFSYLPPISKSLWTITVETVLEYGRIIWDIFGEERLLRFLVHNPDDVLALNAWKDCQNIGAISELFAKAGLPNRNGSGSLKLALQKAIIALSEPTEEQAQAVIKSKSSGKVTNCGRIILITSCTKDLGLEDVFMSTLVQHNRVASASDQMLPVHECEFVILSLHAKGKERAARISNSPMHDLSATVHSETWIISPETIHEKLIEICTRQHGLVTTTVTGIPMKEEQNSQSSSNYDVPLFHPRLPTTSTETMLLKWASPVNAKQGLGTAHLCASACRVTPVDIISRPSTCLTNFVSSGRSVWLETPKKGKAAASSHVLTSHGSEIWMHVMETSRNILEDPPSISEGLGGRVTDYRITDFVEFMKLNMLVPYAPPPPPATTTQSKHGSSGRKRSLDEKLCKPNEMGKERLRRKTEYWPLTIGGSLLFPMAVHLEPLLRLIPKDTLDEMEKVECDKTIWSLMSIEARGDPPPVPSPHHKKGHKRDEQWKSVYNEIEKFIQANLHSPAHEKVLQCFQASRRQDGKAGTNGSSSSTGNGSTSKLDQILDEVSKAATTKTLSTVIKSTSSIADSPMSPTTSPKRTTSPAPAGGASVLLLSKTSIRRDATVDEDEDDEPPKLNLLELWRMRTTKPDFRKLPDQIKLYPRIEALQQLKEKEAAEQQQGGGGGGGGTTQVPSAKSAKVS